MSDMGWQVALLLTLAVFLILCGIALFLVGISREAPRLPPPDYRVGRSCFSEWRNRK